MSIGMDLIPSIAIERRDAVFSDDRTYRYALTVTWNVELPKVCFIGLNPSTADEQNDDPTLRRVKRFAKDWGFGGLWMVNLFALRSTDPSALVRHNSPVSEQDGGIRWRSVEGRVLLPRNDFYLWTAHNGSALTIAAWGTKGTLNGRDAQVKALLGNLSCLRRTKAGHPEHPLYIPAHTKPIEFQP